MTTVTIFPCRANSREERNKSAAEGRTAMGIADTREQEPSGPYCGGKGMGAPALSNSGSSVAVVPCGG
jgi:hypothetical protein